MTVKLPKIRGFQHVVKELRYSGGDVTEMTWTPKLKLHGTNAAIRFEHGGKVTAQKRSEDIWVGNDNFDFALFVEAYKRQLQDWGAEALRYAGPNDAIVIHGEWAGPGIQKSVAVSQIPQKYFFPFAITVVDDGKKIFDFSDGVIPSGEVIRIPNWIKIQQYAPSITVDIRFHQNLVDLAAWANTEVEKIEAEDPFIKEHFGISGIGEGLVFYPEVGLSLGMCSHSSFEKYAFKVKGEKHAVNKAGKPARIKSDIPADAYVFADQHLTNARLEQGLQEVGQDITLTGKFIGWICKDIATESALEIQESGMDWKTQLSGVITTRAREWYIRKCEEI